MALKVVADNHSTPAPPKPSKPPPFDPEVISIIKPRVADKDVVLVCACGCRTWYMCFDGVARCAECDRPPTPDTNDARWYENLPPPPTTTTLPPNNKSDAVTVFNEPRQVMNKILNEIERRWATLTAYIAVFEDGHISTYSKDFLDHNDPSDKELIEWYEARLAQGTKLVMQRDRDKVATGSNK